MRPWVQQASQPQETLEEVLCLPISTQYNPTRAYSRVKSSCWVKITVISEGGGTEEASFSSGAIFSFFSRVFWFSKWSLPFKETQPKHWSLPSQHRVEVSFEGRHGIEEWWGEEEGGGNHHRKPLLGKHHSSWSEVQQPVYRESTASGLQSTFRDTEEEEDPR